MTGTANAALRVRIMRPAGFPGTGCIYFRRNVTVGPMSLFAKASGLATLVAVLCFSAPGASAQVAPVQYWIPGGPFGFGGGASEGQSADSYTNAPGFDATSGRYNFQNGWFVGGERGNLGFSGLSRASAFGSFGALSYEGVQMGKTFKGIGDSPVTFFAGFDALKYNPGGVTPMGPFNNNFSTNAGYSMHGGVEFKPASNVSLQFGVGYTQQGSTRVDSDINSNLLPGQSAMFGGR